MTLQPRERRLIALLAVIVPAIFIFRWVTAEPTVAPATTAPTAEVAERRLARLRDLAAQTPPKQEFLKQVSAELTTREKGLLAADTAAQAQAQLVQIMRRMGQAEAPPIEIRGAEIGSIASLGESYGEVSVAITIECRIEQLINLLASFPAQPEIVATRELRIAATRNKEKTLSVRLTICGVVPRRLVPEKKGSAL